MLATYPHRKVQKAYAKVLSELRHLRRKNNWRWRQFPYEFTVFRNICGMVVRSNITAVEEVELITGERTVRALSEIHWFRFPKTKRWHKIVIPSPFQLASLLEKVMQATYLEQFVAWIQLHDRGCQSQFHQRRQESDGSTRYLCHTCSSSMLLSQDLCSP